MPTLFFNIGGLKSLYQLPITHYQLPITHYQLPITNYQFSLLPHVSEKGYIVNSLIFIYYNSQLRNNKIVTLHCFLQITVKLF
jgi:hypothetical protein